MVGNQNVRINHALENVCRVRGGNLLKNKPLILQISFLKIYLLFENRVIERKDRNSGLPSAGSFCIWKGHNS